MGFGRTVKGEKWGPRWLLWKVAGGIAMECERRMTGEELREWGDRRTDRELSDYELDKLVRLVREHPAYHALPETPEDPLRE